MHGLLSYFSNVPNILLLVFGFGFVIFWRELGHFLAAKWAGVRVEQFAVGFGQALLSWRKGLGWRVGSSRDEFDQRLDRHLAEMQSGRNTSAEVPLDTEQRRELAAEALNLGETEYRLNWIP